MGDGVIVGTDLGIFLDDNLILRLGNQELMSLLELGVNAKFLEVGIKQHCVVSFSLYILLFRILSIVRFI